MKRFLNLLIAMIAVAFFSTTTKGQNLVPNPSFEDTVACPTNYAQINRASNWSAFRISPDYFNSCNNTYVGVPKNDEGFQDARTGNAYAGLFTYAAHGINGREVMGIQLIEPLIVNQRYYIEFYVSLAIGSIQRTSIASNKIGARFTTSQFTGVNPIPIDNWAHIYADSLITDTINWIKVSGFFKADSAYNYLAIGNFFNDSATMHFDYDTAGAFAYYYIDDVLVILDTVEGTTDLDANHSIKIYPNPANEVLTIEAEDIKSFAISDCLGRVVNEVITKDSKNLIDLTQLAPGLYNIRIITINKSSCYKLIHK